MGDTLENWENHGGRSGGILQATGKLTAGSRKNRRTECGRIGGILQETRKMTAGAGKWTENSEKMEIRENALRAEWGDT